MAVEVGGSGGGGGVSWGGSRGAQGSGCPAVTPRFRAGRLAQTASPVKPSRCWVRQGGKAAIKQCVTTAFLYTAVLLLLGLTAGLSHLFCNNKPSLLEDCFLPDEERRTSAENFWVSVDK